MQAIPRSNTRVSSGTRRAPRYVLVGAWAAGIIAALLFASTHAAEPSISASNARIRLLPGNLPLAGYVDLVNTGGHPLSLTAASSPMFAMVEFHKSVHEGGTVGMVPVERIDLAPQESIRLAPGGMHLMLMGRLKPLKIGEKVPMILRFADGRTITLSFAVRGATTQ